MTEPRSDIGNAARGENEGIAARQNGLPDLRVVADVSKSGLEIGIRERRAVVGSNHLATEAEAAVDWADGCDLEEHAVGIAMHETGERAFRVIADRVCTLRGMMVELAR